jgi:hypothetical protein
MVATWVLPAIPGSQFMNPQNVNPTFFDQKQPCIGPSEEYLELAIM